jgi:hypothetical protein
MYALDHALDRPDEMEPSIYMDPVTRTAWHPIWALQEDARIIVGVRRPPSESTMGTLLDVGMSQTVAKLMRYLDFLLDLSQRVH